MQREWDRSLSELWREQAERTPEALAVHFGGERLTYRELAARARRVAGHVQQAGVRPGQLVALFVEPSCSAVAALLGVIEAGAAYLPLDPGYPGEQLRFMLDDARPALVLADVSLRGRLPSSTEGHVLDLARAAAAEPESPAAPAFACGQSLAYVMYTSGSTGRPKGVCVPQRAVARLVIDSDYAPLGPHDRLAQVSNWSFDASTFEIWGALLNGGALIGVPRTTLLEPRALGRALEHHCISATFLTVSVFNLLARESPRSLRGLRHVLFGGEAASADAVRLALAEAGSARLINGYGPTENTTFTTWHHVRELPARAVSVPIGGPIRHSCARVLDPDLRPVAPGEEGELCVGGAGLAHGYLARPELTAERFVPDPLAEEPGARLYRTGDLVRRREDGALEFQGRLDQQVKLRGFRIELGEIEYALRTHAEVEDAVVVLREHAGDKRLVAYVVPRDVAPDPVALRAFAAERLPAHMLPAAFVPLAALPLTANGKVDRRALPAPAVVADDADAAHDTATALASIWRGLLQVERVEADDEFFLLGGNSLLVTRLLTRVREVLQVELSPAQVFAHLEFGRLVELVERLRAQSGGRAPAVVVTPPPSGEAPLSFSQESIWILQQLHPESRAYHFQASLRLRGVLDAAALERALGEIVRRHAILRTTFHVDADGVPRQRLHAEAPASVRAVDLRARPHELQALVADELARPFDVERLPLVRFTLARLGDDEHVLLHVEHHLLHDGWSFNVLLSELAALYAAYAAGRPSPLAEPGLQFHDFARWQRTWIEGDEAREQIEWWRRGLSGSTATLDLPADRPRPPVPSQRGAVLRADLPDELCRELRAFSRREGVTLYTTLLSAFFALLARYTGQEDFNVGCGMANRRWPGSERVVGMFINTLVLRADLAGDPSARELLRRVRALTRDAFERQDLPFERLVEALQVPRHAGLNPLFQVAFSFHDAPLAGFEFPGLDARLTEGLSNGSAKFDMNVIAITRREQVRGTGARADDAITLVWEYASDLFDPATVEELLGAYRCLLRAFVDTPEACVAELPLAEPADRDDARGLCLHQRVAAHAARRPYLAAVESGPEALTYAELHARAAGLGAALRARGVGPETVVGLCLGRGLDLPVAALGVLHAGAAFLPLDPAYPEARLRQMVADSGTRLVLTRRASVDMPEVAGVSVVDLAELAGIAPDADAPAPLPDQAAYVIFTSGSSGRPKGALLTHAGLTNCLEAQGAAFGLRPGERVAQLAALSFDASVFELALALAHGATLCLAPPGPAQGGADLGEFLRSRRVGVALMPPSLLAALEPEDVAGVRLLLTAGEACSVELVRRFAAGRRFFNLYGPSEATIWATSAECTPADGDTPIGHAIPGARVHVLDPRLRAVPVGVAGELYIGGAGVGRGYLGRPDLTAAAFVPDPFAGVPGARLYRTGDRVRARRDGQLEYLGRMDRQVKVRGFRIEPGEIESALRALPAVRDAAVEVIEPAPGDRRLAAYIVVREAGTTAAAVKALLAHSLPAHMVPGSWVLLDALPLTPSGKVDRRALPPPAPALAVPSLPATAPAPVEAPAAPREAHEGVIAAVWAEVLGLASVGREDNFFELGGDSIHCIRVVSRLKQRGLRVTPLALFQHQTVAALAASLGGPEVPAAVTAAPAPVVAPAAVAAPAAARESHEDVIAAVWAEVLGLASVGREDNFFELGGDSIHCIRVVSRLKQRGLRATPLALFQHQTVAALAASLAAQATPPAAGAPAAVPAAVVPETAFPLTPLQHGLLFHALYEGDTPLYHELVHMELSGPLDVPAYARAFTHIYAAHEALRSVFRWDDVDQPRQIVLPARPVELPVDDLRGLTDERQRRRIDEYCREDWTQPYDLARGPLTRLRLFDLGARRFHLVWSIHHMLLDGWSKTNVMVDLAAAYEAFSTGRVPAPTRSRPYGDYIDWLRGRDAREADAFWRRTLGGFEQPTPLPWDRSPGARRTRESDEVVQALPAELSDRLLAAARRQHLTPSALVRACWALALGRWSGTDDVLFGVTVSGRPAELPGVEFMVGPFTNTLAARASLSSAPHLAALAHALQAQLLAARAHEHSSLAEIQQASGVPAGRNLFDSLVAYQNYPIDTRPRAMGAVRIDIPVARESAHHDLVLTVWGTAPMNVRLCYATDVFEAATARRMTDEFLDLLRACVDDPERPFEAHRAPAARPALDQADLDALLVGEERVS